MAEKLAARPTAFPSFSKIRIDVLCKRIQTILLSSPPTRQSNLLQPGGTVLVKRFPTDAGNHLESLSASKVSVYQHIGNDQYRLIYDRTLSQRQAVLTTPFSLLNRGRLPPIPRTLSRCQTVRRWSGPTLFSITAYHGTPHKVDRFRLDKIGTGRSAQAYGWGLYFAEQQPSCGGYQSRIAGAQWVDKAGRPRTAIEVEAV